MRVERGKEKDKERRETEEREEKKKKEERKRRGHKELEMTFVKGVAALVFNVGRDDLMEGLFVVVKRADGDDEEGHSSDEERGEDGHGPTDIKSVNEERRDQELSDNKGELDKQNDRRCSSTGRCGTVCDREGHDAVPVGHPKEA